VILSDPAKSWHCWTSNKSKMVQDTARLTRVH